MMPKPTRLTFTNCFPTSACLLNMSQIRATKPDLQESERSKLKLAQANFARKRQHNGRPIFSQAAMTSYRVREVTLQKGYFARHVCTIGICSLSYMQCSVLAQSGRYACVLFPEDSCSVFISPGEAKYTTRNISDLC